MNRCTFLQTISKEKQDFEMKWAAHGGYKKITKMKRITKRGVVLTKSEG